MITEAERAEIRALTPTREQREAMAAVGAAFRAVASRSPERQGRHLADRPEHGEETPSDQP